MGPLSGRLSFAMATTLASDLVTCQVVWCYAAAMSRRRRISNRTIASFTSTGLLVAIVVLVYGLDWKAALWADGFNTPPAPAPVSTYYWERVGP